jgi:hypothetical protein
VKRKGATHVLRRRYSLLVGAAAAIVAGLFLGSLSLPLASAQVVEQFTPNADYSGYYIPSSSAGPCSGTNSGSSSATTDTGTVSGGYIDTVSQGADSCVPNHVTRSQGGGFWVDGSWNPGSSGTYYLISDWTYNSIQYSALITNCFGGDTYAGGEVVVNVAAWDQTTATNVYSETYTVFTDNATQGWCFNSGQFEGSNQGVMGQYSGRTQSFGTAGVSSSAVYLSDSNFYQFRSAVIFSTADNCDPTSCSYGSDVYGIQSESEFNLATNFQWTLNWFDVDS